MLSSRRMVEVKRFGAHHVFHDRGTDTRYTMCLPLSDNLYIMSYRLREVGRA